jgi:mannose-6-phosphate isomerase-like protein (cupin superfamily)
MQDNVNRNILKKEVMMQKIFFSTLLAIALLFIVGCNSDNDDPAKVIFPDKVYQNITWSEEELNKDIAIRHLYHSKHSSTHLIRLKGNETPHYYDHHDMTITAVSGRHTLYFADHNISLEPGDVAVIPQGTLHWAENNDPVASTVFAVFSPVYTGDDRHDVE